jgi:hypothetical protein
MGGWLFSRWTLIASLVLALLGCAAAPRLSAPESRLNTAMPVGFSGEVRFAFESAESFRLHSQRTLGRIRTAAGDQPLNILALSGGGAGGAFGAGALVGWSRSGQRPVFNLVTGVSVGALIAPLAFLGRDWDAVLTKALAGESSEHLLQRNLLRALFSTSVYRGQPLVDLVDQFVTDEMVAAVAREYAAGRMLFIETTDLDKGEPVIWNMGEIAAHGGKEARLLFRNVLVASASIPVVFPPVMIEVHEGDHDYEEMHVDGATTVPLFVAPEVAALVTQGAPQLGAVNVYVLVNGQLGHFPSTTKRTTSAILSVAFNTNLTHNIRAALGLAYNFSKRYGMEFQLTEIPNSYAFEGPLDFDPKHMRALFDFAAHCAESGQLWKTLDRTYRDDMSSRAPAPGDTPECPVPAATNSPEATTPVIPQ